MNISIEKIDTFLRSYYDKQSVVKAIVYLVLFLYASRIAPIPPPKFLKIFNNIYFKLFALTLILWIAKFDPAVSLLVAFAFLTLINYANTGSFWETLETVKAPSAIEVDVKTPEDAIKVLANAAMSEKGSDIVSVSQVTDVALSSSVTEESSKAITSLAQQAIVPESGVPEKVKDAITTALSGIPLPTEPTEPVQDKSTGCYSKRIYSMDNVVPITSFVSGDEFSPVKKSD